MAEARCWTNDAKKEVALVNDLNFDLKGGTLMENFSGMMEQTLSGREPEELPVSFMCPAALRRQVKIVAAQEGKTIKGLWVHAMGQYLRHRGKVR